MGGSIAGSLEDPPMLALRPGSGLECRRIARQRILLDHDPASVAAARRASRTPGTSRSPSPMGQNTPRLQTASAGSSPTDDLGIRSSRASLTWTWLIRPAQAAAATGRRRPRGSGPYRGRARSRSLEQSLDLLGGLDGGPELRMERRLVAARAAPVERLGEPATSADQAEGQRERSDRGGPDRGAPRVRGRRVGERRPRRVRIPDRRGGIELVEDRVQLVPGAARLAGSLNGSST